MINYDDVTKEKIKEQNPNQPQIHDHLYRILILFGRSGSCKTNSLFNQVSHQLDFDEIYLNAKDQYEVKYHYLINKQESTGSKHLNDSKAFIKYANDMNDIYKNIEEYIRITNVKY